MILTHTRQIPIKTVYKVEPVSGNPSYRISRNVTVKRAGNRTADRTKYF